MFKHYLQTALRNLRRHRMTSIINVLGLALGLTCFAIAYVMVSYLRSSESAFANSERTYVVGQLAGARLPISSGPLANYLKLDFPQIAVVARATKGPGDDERSFRIGEQDGAARTVFADPAFLEIFRLNFLTGSSRAALSEPRSVVLTESAALRFFGTTDILGKNVILNREPLTVTGVIAAIPQPSHLSDSPLAFMRFEALASMDVLERLLQVEVGISPDQEEWNRFIYLTYVQLPEDKSLSAADLNAHLLDFARRRVPAGTADRSFIARPVSSITLQIGDAAIGSTTVLLLALGGLILVIACLNYVNLAIAQAASRAMEVGLRKTLGASRGQIIYQQIVETALLTLAASVLALIAVAGVVSIVNSSFAIDLRRVLTDRWEYWAFMPAVALVVSILAGTYPAFVTSRVRPVQTLRTRRSLFGGGGLARLLVGVQFAAAGIMVIGVIAMHRQNTALRESLTSHADPVVVLNTNLKTAGVSLDALRSALANNRQIKSVSAIGYTPWGLGRTMFSVGNSPEHSASNTLTLFNAVAPDFFRTFDMKVLAGRVFERGYNDGPAFSDTTLLPAAVIDRSLANRLGYSDPASAVNTTIYLPSRDTPQRARVIGVIETQSLTLLGTGSATANIYSLSPADAGIPVVRIDRNDIAGALAAIDASWTALAPGVPLKRVFADELFEQSYRTLDSARKIIAGIAVFAFITAAMGLVGMAIHVVSHRVHEIGVRKTLGASQRRILSMLLWDFSKPVLIANLIAWPVAGLFAKSYQSAMVQPASLSVFPFLAGLAITLAIAWLAVGMQTMRAARLNPATVLRYE